jgi:hypothetical protein
MTIALPKDGPVKVSSSSQCRIAGWQRHAQTSDRSFADQRPVEQGAGVCWKLMARRADAMLQSARAFL